LNELKLSFFEDEESTGDEGAEPIDGDGEYDCIKGEDGIMFP